MGSFWTYPKFSKWSHCAISTLCGIVCYFYVLYRVMKMREGFFWWKLCFCVKLVLHPLGVLASWNKRPIVRPRKKRLEGDSFRESMEKKDLYLCYNVVVSLKIDRIRLSKFFFYDMKNILTCSITWYDIKG